MNDIEPNLQLPTSSSAVFTFPHTNCTIALGQVRSAILVDSNISEKTEIIAITFTDGSSQRFKCSSSAATMLTEELDKYGSLMAEAEAQGNGVISGELDKLIGDELKGRLDDVFDVAAESTRLKTEESTFETSRELAAQHKELIDLCKKQADIISEVNESLRSAEDSLVRSVKLVEELLGR